MSVPEVSKLRNDMIDRIADEIIEGLKRENNKPFSGLALSPIEAVDLLRRRVKAQSSGETMSESHDG